MDFEVLAVKSIADFLDTNILIYFVLEGEAELSVNGVDTVLADGDFLLVNACQHHAYRVLFHALTVRFEVNVPEFLKYYDAQGMEFHCNSTQGRNEHADSFRTLLGACMEHYYGKIAADGKSLLRLNGIYYQILERLITDFTGYDLDGTAMAMNTNEARMSDIVSYIHANYKRRVSLTELSQRMLLSTAYVSRYIKKQFGMTFRDYLTEIRLKYAQRDLENSSKSIGRVALENGFPNQVAFQKAFQDYYHLAPKEYRQNYLKQSARREKGELEDLEYRLMDYLKRQKEERFEEPKQGKILIVDAACCKMIPPNWNRMVNFGSLDGLMKQTMQEQVLLTKKRMNITYIRLWGLCSRQFREKSQSEKQFFSMLDQTMDFLTEHQLRPYLVLSCGFGLCKERCSSGTAWKEKPAFAEELEEYEHFLQTVVLHLVERYGEEEVSRWYFEQWYNPRLRHEGGHEAYFQWFEAVYECVKWVVPRASVGGSYDGGFGGIDYRRLISEWSVRKVQPDFISVHYIPTKPKAEDGRKEAERDFYRTDFLMDYLAECRQFMQEWGMNVPMHVGEWGRTAVGKNVLNDSCFKGAYVMKNLIELCTQVEMAGYWLGSDLLAEEAKSKVPLDGLGGLVSRQGICKPAFYAMEFVGGMGDYLLERSENMMAATDGSGRYVIVCHNYKALGFSYFLSEEKQLKVEKIPFMFDDQSQLRLRVSLHSIKNGTYRVRTKRVGCKNGSVQDEWLSMGLNEQLEEQDVEYLRRTSVPQMTLRECVVREQKLEVSITLEPHEIQCVEISRKEENDDTCDDLV